MLSFITFKNSAEGIEILLDKQGIDDMIHYLEDLKRQEYDLDLIEGNELDRYEVSPDMQDIVCSVKHVRIEYVKQQANT